MRSSVTNSINVFHKLGIFSCRLEKCELIIVRNIVRTLLIWCVAEMLNSVENLLGKIFISADYIQKLEFRKDA